MREPHGYRKLPLTREACDVSFPPAWDNLAFCPYLLSPCPIPVPYPHDPIPLPYPYTPTLSPALSPYHIPCSIPLPYPLPYPPVQSPYPIPLHYPPAHPPTYPLALSPHDPIPLPHIHPAFDMTEHKNIKTIPGFEPTA